MRRTHLYAGQLFVYSASPCAMELCRLGRELAEAAFAPLDPREAQYSMTVESYAAILAELKPKFIHHPKAKACIQGILREAGCDLEQT